MGEEHMKDKIKSFEGFQVISGFAHGRMKFVMSSAHRGDEVTGWVMDHSSIVFDPAENRM